MPEQTAANVRSFEDDSESMNTALGENGLIQCRSVWISDVHLGSSHCKADALLQFLDTIRCERLYLVGDIVDLLAMKRRVHWPDSHNRVLRRFTKLSRKIEVIYIPGNHDYAFRALCNSELGNIQIRRSFFHESPTGERLFVTHGDELDYAVRYSKLNRVIGDIAYDLLMTVTGWVNKVRRMTGCRYWSLAYWVKTHVKQAESAIGAYQQAAINLAQRKGYDGIICGHLHYPAIRTEGGVSYLNTGDWVENCTALVEDFDGTIHLVKGKSKENVPTEMAFHTPVKTLAADGGRLAA